VHIPLTDGITQIRDDLRKAILERKDQDIVFTPQEVELELTITMKMGEVADVGFKPLTFINLSTEATTSKNTEHKIKLTLRSLIKRAIKSRCALIHF
jgi:Trypsin-co-occurring domain 2